MAKPRASVRGIEVERAAKAAATAGRTLRAITFAPDGSVTVLFGDPPPVSGLPAASNNEWDEVLT